MSFPHLVKAAALKLPAAREVVRMAAARQEAPEGGPPAAAHAALELAGAGKLRVQVRHIFALKEHVGRPGKEVEKRVKEEKEAMEITCFTFDMCSLHLCETTSLLEDPCLKKRRLIGGWLWMQLRLLYRFPKSDY